MASQRVSQRRAWSVDDLFEQDFDATSAALMYGSTKMAYSVRGEPKSIAPPSLSWYVSASAHICGGRKKADESFESAACGDSIV